MLPKKEAMKMKLNNNVILITGGTSGIGLALAQRLADMDNQVIVLGRTQTKLDRVLKENPGLVGYQADVSDVATLADLPAWIQTNYPQLNMVINSAGIMRAYDLLDPDVSVAALTAEVQTNLIGTIAIDKLLLPQLTAQPEALIVNVSSGLAYVSSAAHPVYSGTKAAVHMFTSALREQLAYAGDSHVHVLELVPPMVAETNLEANANANATGNMKLSDLIDAAIKGMGNDKIRVNAGAAKMLRLAGKIAPDQIEHRTGKQMLSQYFPDGL